MELSHPSREQLSALPPTLSYESLAAVPSAGGASDEITAPGGAKSSDAGDASQPYEQLAYAAEGVDEYAPAEAAPLPQPWNLETLIDVDRLCDVWIPAGGLTQQPNGTDTVTEVELEYSYVRQLSTPLLRLGAQFNASLDERVPLGHVCSVFACAHVTGFDPIGIEFSPSANLLRERLAPSMAIGDAATDEVLRGLPAGTVVRINDASVDSPAETIHHYAIKANVDNDVPLFLSKFGQRLVALSTFGDVAQFYRGRRVAVVEAMEFTGPAFDQGTEIAIEPGAGPPAAERPQ